MKKTSDEGYIVEFISVGNSIKVTAFDPKTLHEATIIGSPKITQQQLAELAVRKLHYVIEKNEAQ